MRCFVAIEIDAPLRRELGRLQEEIRKQADVHPKQARWVRPELIHLTLKFLGDVPDDRIMDVCHAVEETAGHYSRFELQIESVGTFGRPARVLWAGLLEDEGKAVLKELQGELEEGLEGVGFAAENRQFSGHLTLCRIKNSRAGRVIYQAAQEHRDAKIGALFVESVCVFKSELTKEGPLYTLVSRSDLE